MSIQSRWINSYQALQIANRLTDPERLEDGQNIYDVKGDDFNGYVMNVLNNVAGADPDRRAEVLEVIEDVLEITS